MKDTDRLHDGDNVTVTFPDGTTSTGTVLMKNFCKAVYKVRFDHPESPQGRVKWFKRHDLSPI